MIGDLIRKLSALYGLKPEIIAAVIYQESKGNPLAIRYEPDFYLKLEKRNRFNLSGYVPNAIPTLRSEKVFRSISWGLMQLMGETARVMGFRGDYLSALLDPETNIDLGCRYLKKLLTRSNADYVSALRLYNGSKDYPPIIFRHVESGDYETILSL